MKSVRIFIDYDDVLVDWCTAACETHGLDLKQSEVRQQIENNWGGIDKWVSEEQLWEKIHALGDSWWANLPLLPWAYSLYEGLKTIGEVCILTAPSDHPSCAAGKVASIKKHFNTRDFLIGKPKYMCAGQNAVLIDDRPMNCEKFVERGGQAFCWPNAVKLLRLGGHVDMVRQCFDFVNQVKQHVISGSKFSFYCLPELEEADGT